MGRFLLVGLLLSLGTPADGQEPPTHPKETKPLLLKPARVLAGVALEPQAGWVVLVRGERIDAAGPADQVKTPSDARVLDLPGATLLPGLIDAHSHLLLHPYNEAPWDDQVLK